VKNRKAARPNLASNRAPSAPSAAQRRLAAERAAAARARIADAQRRRQWFIIGGSVLGIIVLVAALVVVKIATGAGGPKSGDKASAADATVMQAITSVPASAFNEVGVGSATAKPIPLKNGTPLTQNGKPEILYIGAEYCPYCAAERWAMAVALSRFGTLHGVGEISSSPTDVYPSTPTLTFHGATYTSSYLAFTPREVQSNQVKNGNYTALDRLTAAQEQLYQKYDAAPYVSSPGIPFIYIAGKYIVSSASYDPQVLHGKSHDQVAAALSDPSSSIARGVLGTANLITAAICSSTNQKPAAVCTSAGVRTAATAVASTQ
jgi:thiol-disulfide isomerase/thioredoxin